MAADPASQEQEVKGGEILLCGSTAWDQIGRKTANEVAGISLLSPSRLRPLMGVPIIYVASGSASCHCVALDAKGQCFTWGRNERGQLGFGDLVSRDLPTLVSSLAKYKIIKAGAGRQFSMVLTDDGDSLAFGCNKHGQLGSGSVKNELESAPVKCLVSKATNIVCGAEFAVWLTSIPGSTILTAGLPQYGQLGHGTDHQYNAKESSVRIAFEPQPRPKAITSLTEKTVVKVACGNNHTVAVDSNGNVYTWGFGGYGRLGHREQKDEFSPRLVEQFQRHNLLPPTAVVAAGSAFSACTAAGGQLYMWGRVKPTGDNWMYPKPVYDMGGWAIHCIDSGDKITFVGAEKSCISWGTSVYGELGYGPTGPKSSASPKKVDVLEGMDVLSVACGVGHSLIVVDTKGFEDRIEKLDVFEGNAAAQGTQPVQRDEEASDKVSNKKSKGRKEDAEGDGRIRDNTSINSSQNGEKRRGRPKKSSDEPAEKKQRGKAEKKKIQSDESEDGEADGDDSDASVESEDGEKRISKKGRSKGHSRGRGGSGGGSSKGDEKETKKSIGRGRGRGRGRKSEA